MKVPETRKLSSIERLPLYQNYIDQLLAEGESL